MEKLRLIPLDSIKISYHLTRITNINFKIEDLCASIKAVGLIQPILVFFDSEKKHYFVLAGQRRLNAHVKLNEDFPGKGFDKIKCIVIDEPKTNEEKNAFSLAENITQEKITKTDLLKSVTKLYSVYQDFEIVQNKFGLTKKIVRKYASKYALLPLFLTHAIDSGEIHSNPRIAMDAAIRSVDALQWTKDGQVREDIVLELAKKYVEIDIQAIWQGHLRDDSGIVGDGYSFEGSMFAVIVVGDDKGIFKNGKKMTRKEFEKLPDEFRNILRLQPTWE
jgi:ParB/RepB/Spo0J family partition protein